MRGWSMAIAIWLSLLVVGARARAEDTAAQTEAKARTMLAAGIDQVVSPQVLAQLGPALPDALIAIFSRSGEARHVRLRALSMLTHFEGVRVTQLFARLVHEGGAAPSANFPDPLHPARSSLVLQRAIAGAARHLTDASALDLTRLLGHQDANVRATVVLALSDYDRADVRAALRLQLTRESSPLVLRALTDRSARLRAPRLSDPKTATPPR